MLEIERKIPITKDEFLYLWQIISPDSVPQKQTNYYYDTDDFSMNKQKITCRIREKNGEYTATVKEHNYIGKTVSKETSLRVENELDTSLFCNEKIRLYGSMVTERVVLLRGSDIELVLDKNTYLGIVDYEIEIEYLHEKESYAQELYLFLATILSCKFKNFSKKEFLKRENVSQNKSARFFDRLKNG